MSKAENWQQTEPFQWGYNKWHPTILGPRLFIMLESLDKYLFWTSACSFACEVCFQRLWSCFASSPWSQSWTGCACFLSLLWGLGTLALCRERHGWSFRKKGFLDSESHFFRNRLPGDGRLPHAGPQVRPGGALCHLWALVESVCLSVMAADSRAGAKMRGAASGWPRSVSYSCSPQTVEDPSFRE